MYLPLCLRKKWKWKKIWRFFPKRFVAVICTTRVAKNFFFQCLRISRYVKEVAEENVFPTNIWVQRQKPIFQIFTAWKLPTNFRWQFASFHLSALTLDKNLSKILRQLHT
jgi:hypothetical protein